MGQPGVTGKETIPAGVQPRDPEARTAVPSCSEHHLPLGTPSALFSRFAISLMGAALSPGSYAPAVDSIVPLHPYVESLPASVMVFRNGAFGEVIRFS